MAFRACLAGRGGQWAAGAHIDDAGGRRSPCPAKDAGARYGEAAGAALLCLDVKITNEVETLRARYQGNELAEFDAQAGKVLKAWQQTKTCELADGPDDCRVSQRWSCQQALKEIGPDGAAVRGLIAPSEGPVRRPGSAAPEAPKQ
ncbi:MAG: hypothetical protein WDN31_21690 [Hyphomicrobium sp.]